MESTYKFPSSLFNPLPTKAKYVQQPAAISQWPMQSSFIQDNSHDWAVGDFICLSDLTQDLVGKRLKMVISQKGAFFSQSEYKQL